jgi:hypothetical protein
MDERRIMSHSLSLGGSSYHTPRLYLHVVGLTKNGIYGQSIPLCVTGTHVGIYGAVVVRMYGDRRYRSR